MFAALSRAQSTISMGVRLAHVLTRFSEVPVDLFRLQSGRVKLRSYDVQKAAGRSVFDLIVHPDGLVHPIEGELFKVPNGCSLRPPSRTMREVVALARAGRGEPPLLILIPKGTPVPKGLTLYLEHSDHYSLQTSEKVTLKELNKRIEEFMKPFQRFTRDEWFKMYPLIEE